MDRVTLRIPHQQVEGCELLVEAGKYPNRSEVIRSAVRDLLREEMPDNKRRAVADGGDDRRGHEMTEPRWFPRDESGKPDARRRMSGGRR